MTIPAIWPFPCVAISEALFPDGDQSTGGWTPTPVYQELDDTSDADFVSTPNFGTSPTSYTFDVHLNNPSGTPGGFLCQDLAVLVRCRKVETVGTGSVDITVSLMDGGGVVAALTAVDIGTSFASILFWLDKAEYESISSHNDLRIKVQATGSADDGLYEVSADCSQARVVYA